MSGKIRDLPVTLNIEGLDGKILSSVIGRINSVAEISLRDVAEISFPLPPTEFKAEGQYRAVVLVDGEPVGHRTFNVSLWMRQLTGAREILADIPCYPSVLPYGVFVGKALWQLRFIHGQ
jgi:hypothetical protein